MAKRDLANLGGLAALGALGYMALKGKGDAAPVVNRDFGSAESPDLGDFNQANYGAQGVSLPVKSAGSSAVGAPDDMGDSSTSSKGKPTDTKYLASRDKQRKVEQDITDKAETDAETARLLARYPMKMAKNLPPDVDPRSAFRGARALQNQADSAAARYFRGKIDRGESLNETEKAQARRAGITGFKKGGAIKVKKMASGGMTTSSASKRADGIAQKGKTRGKMY